MMRKRHEILPTETPRSESTNPPVILGHVRGRGEVRHECRTQAGLFISIYLSINQSIQMCICKNN